MATRRILYNFASRMRPDRCRRGIENIKSMSTGSNMIFAMKFDIDDTYKEEYNSLMGLLTKGSNVFFGVSENKTHAINRAIPEAGWDILVNMSDDIVFTVKGFDDVIRQICGADDFCLFPEPFADSQARKLRKERLAVVSIIGYDYFKRDGYVYHPSYKRTHCDEEATEVARIRGRYKEVNIPIFIHEHPSAGYRKFADAQYLLERSTWQEDLANLNKRRLEGFPK